MQLVRLTFGHLTALEKAPNRAKFFIEILISDNVEYTSSGTHIFDICLSLKIVFCLSLKNGAPLFHLAWHRYDVPEFPSQIH